MIKPILITTGEPAGIGMDILLDLASKGAFAKYSQPNHPNHSGMPSFIVTACHNTLTERLQSLEANSLKANKLLAGSVSTSKSVTWQVIDNFDELENIQVGFTSPNHSSADNASSNNASPNNASPNNASSNNTSINQPDFYLLNVPTNQPVVAGQINHNNASMVLRQLQLAHELAISNKVAGIVTGPLQKSALIDANLTLPDGTMFSGHTEYFMQMSGLNGVDERVVMMLANSKMRVALVTTHLPLSQVASAINQQSVQQTLEIVLNSLKQQFAIKHPKVLVCGLNPHAGEGGHLGTEEIDIINPVLQRFIDQGDDVSLAMPADTLFTSRYLENCDAVIAMYHDQGLPVLKSHGFGDSINITLGLPYIRTSVDHGTALDLAGTGNANSDSMQHAIATLMQMQQT